MKSQVEGKAQIIVITVLATLIIIAGLAFAGMKYGDEFFSDLEEEVNEEVKPFYYSMDKLVISVESEKVIYYMMLEVSLETKNEKTLAQVRHFLPVIRNHFVKSLSQRDFKSMRSSLKNLGSLQQDLLESLQVVLEKYDISKAVDDVLITKLVIQ